jgi:hypothetical protein
MPDVLTLWSLAGLAVGGVMYLVMSRSSTTPPTAQREGLVAEMNGHQRATYVGLSGARMMAAAAALPRSSASGEAKVVTGPCSIVAAAGRV